MTPAPWTAEAERLRPAWELVRPAVNWRGPIATEVTAAELEEVGTTLGEIEEAVIFFTATAPTITEILPGKVWWIKATGYRNGPAGP